MTVNPIYPSAQCIRVHYCATMYMARVLDEFIRSLVISQESDVYN